jgi:hypothetical protein
VQAPQPAAGSPPEKGGEEPAAVQREGRNQVEHAERRVHVGKPEQQVIDQVRRAQRRDLKKFARFSDLEVAVAVAQQLAMDCGRSLRRWGLVPNTITRRWPPSAAWSGWPIRWDWSLEVPRPDELAGVELALIAESRHYLLPRHPSEIDGLDNDGGGWRKPAADPPVARAGASWDGRGGNGSVRGEEFP